MLVGIDFDNTIVCYDSVFHKVAREKELIPPDLPVSKNRVRDHLRRLGKEELWTELQGYVYGARMLEATLFPGVLDFFDRCRYQGISVCIISHRTRYPFIGFSFDLHQAAMDWIKHYGFYERAGISPKHVHFELTREEKLLCIKKEKCDSFIDDIPEFLADTNFPAGVRCILFDPDNHCPLENRFTRAVSWEEISELIMGRRTQF